MINETEQYWFLASPHTHPDPAVREWRYEECCRAFAWLLTKGIWVYPAITCTHPTWVNHLSKMTADFRHWKGLNHAFVRGAVGVFVLRIDGWEQSRGVADEMAFAKELGKPVEFMWPMENEYWIGAKPPPPLLPV